jgi:hypothetical protein
LQWEAIFAATVDHHVAPLVYANLARCPLSALRIPSQTLEKFRLALGQNLVEKMRRADRLARALAVLNERSLDVMLIKGAALDLTVYAPFTLTNSQDVDIVLRSRLGEIAAADRAALSVARHNFPLEYDFFEHHDVTINGVLPVNFDRIWQDAVRVSYAGQPVWIMCPEDLFIAACINACRKRFCRLKAMVDIAEILLAYPELDWDEVARRSVSDQCNNIVYAALLLVGMLLGPQVPKSVLDRLETRPVRSAVIRFLVRRLHSYSWTAPPVGVQVFNRDVNLSLLLPYMTYRTDQIQRKLDFVWRSRMGTITR